MPRPPRPRPAYQRWLGVALCALVATPGDASSHQRNAQRGSPYDLRTDAPPSPRPELGRQDVQAGYRLFFERTCASCHAIRGTPADGQTGPNLTHLMSRPIIAGAILTNTPYNLARWVKNPQIIKPGNGMPDLHLTDREVWQIVAYLETLE